MNLTSLPPSPISGLYLDWGIRPPINATVYIGNLTDGQGGVYGNEIQIPVLGIEPSLPYDAMAEAGSRQEVLPVVGNSTSVAVEGSAWSGDYVRLVVEGCWEGDGDGDGATVGEFVVIGG